MKRSDSGLQKLKDLILAPDPARGGETLDWFGFERRDGTWVRWVTWNPVDLLRYWEAEGVLDQFVDHARAEGWVRSDPDLILKRYRSGRELAAGISREVWERALDGVSESGSSGFFPWELLLPLADCFGPEDLDRWPWVSLRTPIALLGHQEARKTDRNTSSGFRWSDGFSALLHLLISSHTSLEDGVRSLLDVPVLGVTPIAWAEPAFLPPGARERFRRVVVEATQSLEDEESRLRCIARYGPVRLDEMVVDKLSELRSHRGREKKLLRAAYSQLEGGSDLVPGLRKQSLARRWIAYSLARPGLRESILDSMDETSDRNQLASLLSGPWPPVQTIPRGLPLETLEILREIAFEKPGYRKGPDPDSAAKVARLLLAACGFWSAEEVEGWALEAYEYPQSRLGHDAVACALVHPGIEEKQFLANLLWENSLKQQGWRSRRKLNQILRWAGERRWIRMPWESAR
ncbi:MAG: hypothetical protein QF752_08060 [Planctomycetota bacterium]|nr:hypothetical protein [Planctomycetota bacterium]